MGGIFGILNLDGQPVALESLEAMRDSMAFCGIEGVSIWQGESIGLGYLSQHKSPEANYEFPPFQHPASGVVLTAQARIDNREELWSVIANEVKQSPRNGEIASLRDASRSSQTALLAMTSDSELILYAYLHWGEECVQHLLGDWAFAIWDPRERKLFAARDQGGISSFYYYHNPRFFAFASSIKALLALPQIPKRPNLRNIARYLAVEMGDNAQPSFQTAYEEILHLRPAHTLTVTKEKTEARQYWFLENTPSLRLGSDDEYLEAFLEIYTEAVRCRLRSPLLSGEGPGHVLSEVEGVRSGVGAALSSGLDSGSLCALAACELGLRGQRLPAFTSVPIYDTQNATPRGRYGDETALVELNRQFIGNLDVHYIRAEHAGILAGMERGLELHDRPTLAPSHMFWIYALLEAMQEQGLDVLLTGQAGNATISWAGAVESFWPLILTGQWKTLRGKYKRSGLSPWKTVKRHMLRPLAKQAQSILGTFAPRKAQADFSPANPEWARSIAAKQGKWGDSFFAPPSDLRQERVKKISTTRNGGAIWAETGFAYGLDVRDPTMDRRLMEFCLAIPAEQYRLDGQDRALIRRAMQGLLPEEVRLNTQRGLQAADLGYRLLAELPQAQALMARLERSELARQVLNLPKMNGMLAALQKEVNVKTTQDCNAVLLNGMMAGLFLLRFDG